MVSRLRRLVDLRPGERGLALRAMAALFGLIAGHTILETARDTLFLGKLPASRLTLVYAALAGLSLVAVKVNAAFVQRFGRRNTLIFTLMAAAYGTTVIHLTPRTPEMAFVLYLWSGLLGTVMVVQFWMLAGHTFTVAQGKRLFGPLAAGGVLGAVTGAGAAAAILTRFHVGSLLVVASVVFLATGLLLTGEASDHTRPSVSEEAPGTSVAWSGLRGDPYLLRLCGLVAAVTAAVLIADYLFKSRAAAAYRGQELGSFIAQYYAVLNAVALVVQLALTSVAVRRLGVIGALSVLPGLLFLGAGGVVLTGGALFATLMTRGADGAMRHSLHRVALELTWMPVPDSVKGLAKTFADTVLGRGVQAVVAAILLGLAVLSLDHPVVLGGLIAALAAAAIALSVSLRRPYLALFRRALARSSMPSEVGDLELDLDSVEVLIEALSSREPNRAVAAIDLLAAQHRARLIPSLILYHESDQVVIRALDAIATPDRTDWIPLAERLLDHQDEAVRVAAVRALVGSAQHEAAETRLSDISPAVRAHTAFCLLLREKAALPHRDPRIREILAIDGARRLEARGALLDALARRGDDRWRDVILEIADAGEDTLNTQLAEAMTRVRDPAFVDILVDRVDAREGRSAVRRALVAYGDEALEALARKLRDPDTDPHLRLHLPRTISQFRSQAAADLLIDLLTGDRSGAVRYKALRGLGRMIEGSQLKVDRDRLIGQLRLNLVEVLRLRGLLVALRDERDLPAAAQVSRRLLVELLDDKQRQAIERVFRVLQIVHRSEDLRSAYLALSTGDRRIAATAAEFLDALTVRYRLHGPDYQASRDLLRILADDLPVREQIARADGLVPPPPASPRAALAQLVREPDVAVATIAAHHARNLGDEGLAALAPREHAHDEHSHRRAREGGRG